MYSILPSSLRRADSAFASKGKSHLAGRAVHLLGRAQVVSALAVSTLAPADALVLNIGRTNSRFVRHLKTSQPAARVVSLQPTFRKAATDLQADRVSRRVPEALPYAAGTFNAVISLFSLHFWRTVPEAFSEMARVLTPGGILLVSELSVEDLAGCPERTRRIARFMFETGPRVTDYYRWLDSAELRILEAIPTLSHGHGLLFTAQKGSQWIS
jgi:SAM-dependent methyltransferase